MLNDKVLPYFEAHQLPMLRILTDRGTEYCGRVEHHDYLLYLAINDIDHTKTKAMSPPRPMVSANASIRRSYRSFTKLLLEKTVFKYGGATKRSRRLDELL